MIIPVIHTDLSTVASPTNSSTCEPTDRSPQNVRDLAVTPCSDSSRGGIK